MPGDENLGLTSEQVAAIGVCSDAWFAANAAGDQAGKDAAHAAANEIRNMKQSNLDSSVGGYAGTGGGLMPGMMLPPTSMDVLVVDFKMNIEKSAHYNDKLPLK